ncbi:MAG: homocysteine S-methyltransferase family protein [Gammaproteobacteria bacterium]|nr:homocysteine S-methyltransferase family protein [Gammaproteobacteria bacterium]
MSEVTEKSVTVFDGSMGEELADRGFSTRDGLWSAGALLNHPTEVYRLHRDYLNVGAQIIITNTYSTIPSYLEKAGMGHRVRELTLLATQLARQALDDVNSAARTSRLAGCLPPLSESYRPDLVPPVHEAKPIYSELIDCMASSVDVFLAETMSSIDEAMHVAECRAAHKRAVNLPWLVAFTLDDTKEAVLRSGEGIEAAIRAVARFQPEAILFNCSTPEAILSSIAAAAKLKVCKVGGYPNRFNPVPMGWTLDDEQEITRNVELNVDAFVSWSQRFIAAGAEYVGGCCGIGPRYIEALTTSLNSAVPDTQQVVASHN